MGQKEGRILKIGIRAECSSGGFFETGPELGLSNSRFTIWPSKQIEKLTKLTTYSVHKKIGSRKQLILNCSS